MSINAFVRRILAGGVLAACVAGPAAAQDPIAQFYKGNTIRVIIGSSAGGGYDTYARLIARYMGKYIPGNPTILPVNMPGAGSRTAAYYVYGVAPKDGTVIGAIFPGAIMEPLLGDKSRVKHDPQKFVYLGTATRDVYLCLVRTDAPAKNFKEALTKEITVGATAPGASTHDFPVMLHNVLGAKIKVVSGYKGSHEIMLAVEKNEVQGACGISWPTVATHFSSWIDKKFALPMVQEGVSGHPAMNKLGTPLAIDFAKTPDDRKILDLVYSQLIFGRPYVMAPETPPDRVAALRKAFMATLSDKQLLADAAKMGVDIDPVAGDELQKLIAKIFATPPEVIARAKAALVQTK
jgi:tripartite-type tricarboxylate transporter receptor subunit TctC